MLQYDASKDPDPAAWLAMDEAERILAIEKCHRRIGDKFPRPQVHASMHAVIENQLAVNDPPFVRAALDRLLREGLDRHNAIHAIAGVFAQQMHALLKNKPAGGFDLAQYEKGLGQLDAAQWLKGG